MERINAVGRRKAAIARVYVSEGTGVITVNKRSLEEYFPNPILQFIVKQPLNTLEASQPDWWWLQGPGRGSASGHCSRVGQDQPRGQECSAPRRLHDSRPSCGRAQEARSAQGSQAFPVQQALIGYTLYIIYDSVVLLASAWWRDHRRPASEFSIQTA